MKTKKYCKVLFYYLPTLPSFKLGDVGSTFTKIIFVTKPASDVWFSLLGSL